MLKEGWVLFLSKASVSLYTAGNAFILGMVTDHTVVGYYSAAEKIVKSILGFLGPIAQAVYPRFSKLAAESREMALLWGRRMLLLMGGVGFSLTVVVLVSAPVIVDILLGSQFKPSKAVIRFLSPVIFLVALNNVMGVQILFPLHYDRFVFNSVLTAGLLNVAMALVFVPLWSANGMAISVVITEIFVTLAYARVLILKEGLIGRYGRNV